MNVEIGLDISRDDKVGYSLKPQHIGSSDHLSDGSLRRSLNRLSQPGCHNDYRHGQVYVLSSTESEGAAGGEERLNSLMDVVSLMDAVSLLDVVLLDVVTFLDVQPYRNLCESGIISRHMSYIIQCMSVLLIN